MIDKEQNIYSDQYKLTAFNDLCKVAFQDI
mgnify:CR=1 FL=1